MRRIGESNNNVYLNSLFNNNKKTNKKVTTINKWRCKVCILKRELAKKSGYWASKLEKNEPDKMLLPQPQQHHLISQLKTTIANESS